VRDERARHVGAEHGELLVDLRRVAVLADVVGVDVLVDGDEVGLGRRAAARARHAGLRVDDDVVDQARAGQRREREHRGRREAAGVRGDVRVAQLVAVELGQPVDRVAEQPGRAVLAVPRA
jgi:hypothetical protein